MGIRTNTLNLGGHYDLTNSGQNAYVGSKALFAWGNNGGGRLGQNNITSYSSPVQVPGTTWISISGSSNTFAIKTDGTLWSWGSNGNGQLGQNNTTNISSPVQIPGTTWRSISSGSYHALATKTDGTLWAWGKGDGNLGAGQLAQNNTVSYSSPVQIPGTTWRSAISSDFFMSVATKTDGTLWVWGSNWNGQLGNSQSYASLIGASSPIQIPGTTWNSISAGRGHTLATKTDNTLWAWGGNVQGQLGLNDTTVYSSPRQIPGTTWSFINAADSNFSFATKTDGTLWAWGYNDVGQLGQNNRTYYSSPVQIPGTTWNNLGSGSNYALATKTDGTLWSWGYNSNGQLGQNNRTQFSSPVQIPGTTWSSSNDTGNQHSIALQLQ
jgi:alpha-tubulin suppressor-like RCC1 family protein